MKCLFCQGQLRKGTAPFHVDRKGCHLTLDRVPAWVCGQCGEVLFDESEVEAVQNLIRSVVEKAEVIELTA